MTVIEFKTDPIASFFSLWSYGLTELSNPTTERKITFSKLLNSYQSQSIPKLQKTFPSFKDKSDEEKKGYIESVKQITHNVNNACYDSSEKLINDMVSMFHLSESEKEILTNAYSSYQKFYELNKPNIIKSRSAITNTYKEQGVYDYLKKMYSFFQINESQKANAYLHHYPNVLMDTGKSEGNTIHQNISLTKNEDENNYLKNSCILNRRMFTPIHELGHFLFGKSNSAQDVLKNKNTAAHQVFQQLKNYFSLKSNKPETYAYACIHEAFASSCSCFFQAQKKPTFDPLKMKNLNSNFKEADALTRIFYPIYQQCLKSNNTISDNFFKKVLNDPAFQQNFKQPPKLSAKSSERD